MTIYDEDGFPLIVETDTLTNKQFNRLQREVDAGEYVYKTDVYVRFKDPDNLMLGRVMMLWEGLRDGDSSAESLTSAAEYDKATAWFGVIDEKARRRKDGGGRRLTLRTASTVEAKRVRWLVKGWLPIGAITVMAGMPGTGKSTISIDWAARVTRGDLGDGMVAPRDVLIYSTEDAKEQVIVPRLIAAGADLDRVHFIEVAEEDDKGVRTGATLVLPIDVEELRDAITETDAAMVVFDPLMSVTDPKRSANQDRELRTSLEPLAELLASTQCVGVGLAHFRKQSGATIDLIMGSRAFTGVARSVLVTLEDTDADEMLLTLEKTNYGMLDIPGKRYRVGTTSVMLEGEYDTVPRIDWLGDTEGSGRKRAAAILGTDRSAKRDTTAEAGDWLLVHLRRAGGAGWSDEVKRAAEAVDIKPSTLARARKRVKVHDKRTGFGGKTLWHLDGWSLEEHGLPAMSPTVVKPDEPTAPEAAAPPVPPPKAPDQIDAEVQADADRERGFGS